MNEKIKYLLVEISTIDGLMWVKGFENKDSAYDYMVQEYNAEIEELGIDPQDDLNCTLSFCYANVYHEKSMEDVSWEIVNVDDIEIVVNEAD